MKKFGKILLVASSVLSVGALALTINAVSENKDFTYSVGETNNDGFGIKKVLEGEKVDTPTFTTGGASTRISPAVAQAKSNENNTKSLRFVAAVSMENDAVFNEYLTGLNGKEIGFHVAYQKDSNEIDAHLRVEYAYRSITAGSTVYRASGELQEGEKGIADWIKACGTVYASPEEVTYNYFLCLEIDNITEAYLSNIITVQPYIRDVVNEETQYTYASHYKKATAIERSLFFLDVNGKQTLMKDNPENGTTESGDIKDEYMLQNVELTKGDVVTIRDSIGVSHDKFDHCLYKESTGFTAEKTCKYDFYYKTKQNTNGSDNTYVSQHIITYYFIDRSWWNKDEACSAIYMWNSQDESQINKKYPGVLMTKVGNYSSDNTRIVWSFDVDFDAGFDSFLFARTNSAGDSDWGAKTVNMKLTNNYNQFRLKDNEAWGTGVETVWDIQRP